MGVNDEAEALKQRLLAEADEATAERVRAGLEALASMHPAARALGPGDTAPDFTLRDLHGRPVRLHDHLARGPVVLSFIRGGWCPFCSLELRAWQARIEALHEAGGDLLAITPEVPADARARAEALELAFPVLSDVDQAVSADYGLVFGLPDAAREAQDRLDAPLDRVNADGSWRLPVPATYVVAADGRIRWAYVADDYTRRAEPAKVIEAVRELA